MYKTFKEIEINSWFVVPNGTGIARRKINGHSADKGEGTKAHLVVPDFPVYPITRIEVENVS